MKDSEQGTLGHNYRFFYFCKGHYGASVPPWAAEPTHYSLPSVFRAAMPNSEWTELERVFRNTFNLTPQSLKETHPGLTKGDFRRKVAEG